MTLSFAGQGHKWNTADDASNVVQFIKDSKELKCLKLEANTLGVDAAKVIGDALAEHPEFEKAHWKDLFTGRLKTEIPDALRHLFSGLLRANAKLKELDLSDNALGPIGVEGMVDFMSSPVCYSLEEIHLNNNGLGIKGGTMLCKSLLKLADNAKAAGTPLKLKVFISGRNRLEKEGAKIFSQFFAKVGSLEVVSMPQNGITHVGIAALAEAFSQNPNLKTINLNDNTFAPIGAKAMAKYLPDMQNLRVINFGDCLIKTSGAKHIASALTDNHLLLEELHLDSNEIKIEGGIAVAEAMKNKDNLKVLMLDTNMFGEKGVETLTEHLESIGKSDSLQPLEDDEGSEDEEEDEDEDREDEESSDEEKSEEEEEENDVVEVEKAPVEPEAPTGIIPISCTAAEFKQQPSAARLLGLGSAPANKLMVMARGGADGSPDSLISSYTDILMRVLSLGASTDEQVKNQIKEICNEIAKETFSIAAENDSISMLTNEILVYLGLIKSEDKKFRVEWDIGGCILALAQLVPEPYFSKETKDTLQLFMVKLSSKLLNYTNETHVLMTALYA